MSMHLLYSLSNCKALAFFILFVVVVIVVFQYLKNKQKNLTIRIIPVGGGCSKF